uniref:UV radiation resistance associated protein n=1 Tax=Cacopsylla melanoneura TaxID=428564 RepID=A0A8D8S0W8_9HEMI
MSIRAPLRWKEWIPLATQQQRLRNLIQIMAYNMQHDKKVNNDIIDKYSYYYTLHATTMSSPMYMSEKVESEHPKWMEVEFSIEQGTFTGVIIRLWSHNLRTQTDAVISVSGVYFSGLVYIGPRLLQTDPVLFKGNSLIFFMHGGYFTCPNNFLNEQPEYARITNISLKPKQVRSSYTINMLSKLHYLQQEIKRQSAECDFVREKIAEGGNPSDKFANSSATLRKLLSKNKPKPSLEQLTNVKKLIEDARFRVGLLKQEKIKMEGQVEERHVIRDRDKDLINDLGCDLMNKYRTLNKDMNRLKERKKHNEERKHIVMNVTSQLLHRRQQLIADLNYIFPIEEVSEDELKICSVPLPNSEHLSDSSSDSAPAVALGLVVSLIQAISTFLSLPLRYPVIQMSSRSKVIDPITVDIPDSEREFALYPRGSSYRHQFHYGVYLINKNIAQLRLDCGLNTADLRPTLANLYSLLNLKRSLGVDGLSRHRSMSGSTLESSSLGTSPSSSHTPSSSPSPSLFFHKTMSDPIMKRNINPVLASSSPSSNFFPSSIDWSAPVLMFTVESPGINTSSSSVDRSDPILINNTKSTLATSSPNSVDSAGSGGGQYEYSQVNSQHESVVR